MVRFTASLCVLLVLSNCVWRDYEDYATDNDRGTTEFEEVAEDGEQFANASRRFHGAILGRNYCPQEEEVTRSGGTATGDTALDSGRMDGSAHVGTGKDFNC